jgi:glycine/D-amino acid oxidase-like deaminating enzyme
MIAILGGGIAGASLARALAVRGRSDVVVFDQRPPAAGSTGRATGGFRTQFESKLNIALSLASRPFFVERAERIRFQSVGYLYPAEDPATAQKLKQRAEIQVAAGLPIAHPDPATLIPFFDTSRVIATNFCHLDGTYYPPLVLQAFIEEAREAGATFRYESEAGPQDLDAEVVVIAAGSWSRQVGAALGVVLAVEPVERGTFLVNPGVALPNNVPFLIDAANGWAMREREGRLLIVPPGDPDRWEETRAWLERYIPTASLDRPEAHWTGFYEVTFDHHPLVGETGRPGVWASCGFSGHGVMHSPAIADNLAAMILGQTPPIDISPLSPLRTEPLVDITQV